MNGQYFIKLNLRLGYYQVWIELGDELESTCVTRYEAIEFFVIPFGLTNAPATFCTLLNYIFHEYLDGLEEHQVHIRLIFDKLRRNQIYVKKEKCTFAQKRINFLGHIIECGKIQMDKEKLRGIKEWRTPTFVTKLCFFLGFANYYRRFIKGFSRRVTLLNELLKKGMTFRWPVKC